MPEEGHGPTRKKSREQSTAPGVVELVMRFDAKAVRQSPIIVRLGADSVNFRQQIYKFLVNVALKPQTAKPSSDERYFLFDQKTSQLQGGGKRRGHIAGTL